MYKIGLLSVLYGSAGRIRGAEKGAKVISDYLLSLEKINSNSWISIQKNPDLQGLQHMEEVIDVSAEIKRRVYEWSIRNNKMLIVGGDHSIALGSISGAALAAAELESKFGVIYLDAHADMNTPWNSPTKNLHGTTLGASMGIGDKSMTCIATVPLEAENLLLIGTRRLDSGERELIKRLNIPVISSLKINNCISTEGSLQPIFNEISNFIFSRKLQRIHLSIDIDVVDPCEAPATGVPENNGITAASLMEITQFLIQNFNVYTVDLVEFFPEIDIHRKTELICRKLGKTIIESL